MLIRNIVVVSRNRNKLRTIKFMLHIHMINVHIVLFNSRINIIYLQKYAAMEGKP